MIQLFVGLYVKQFSLDSQRSGMYSRPYGTVLAMASCNCRNTVLVNFFEGLTHNIMKNNWDFSLHKYDTLEEALYEIGGQQWIGISVDDVPNGNELVKKALDVLTIKEELK